MARPARPVAGNAPALDRNQRPWLT
jgi:hypothetical protein